MAFTDVTGNYNDDAGTVDDAIAKVDPVCSVAGYSVPFDSFSHTATGSCPGVDDEILAGLVLSGTTHTNAGDYLADPWAFTASPATTTTTRARSIRHRQGRPGLLGHRLLGALRHFSHTATGYCLGVNDEILAGLVLSGTTHTNAGD